MLPRYISQSLSVRLWKSLFQKGFHNYFHFYCIIAHYECMCVFTDNVMFWQVADKGHELLVLDITERKVNRFCSIL